MSAHACAFQSLPPSITNGRCACASISRSFCMSRIAGMRGDALVAPGVGDGGGLGLHVLGQREHHRAGPARHRGVERAAHVLGHAVGAVDLRDPLRHLAVHAAVVDLLERLALDEVVADLADEENHRRRILVRGVHADARRWSRRDRA